MIVDASDYPDKLQFFSHSLSRILQGNKARRMPHIVHRNSFEKKRVSSSKSVRWNQLGLADASWCRWIASRMRGSSVVRTTNWTRNMFPWWTREPIQEWSATFETGCIYLLAKHAFPKVRKHCNSRTGNIYPLGVYMAKDWAHRSPARGVQITHFPSRSKVQVAKVIGPLVHTALRHSGSYEESEMHRSSLSQYVS